PIFVSFGVGGRGACSGPLQTWHILNREWMMDRRGRSSRLLDGPTVAMGLFAVLVACYVAIWVTGRLVGRPVDGVADVLAVGREFWWLTLLLTLLVAGCAVALVVVVRRRLAARRERAAVRQHHRRLAGHGNWNGH